MKKLFGKKKVQPIQQDEDSVSLFTQHPEVQKPKSSVLLPGRKTVKDLVAVDVERGGRDYMIIGDKYVRVFMMNGVPAVVSIGWLDDLYNFDGDCDTTINVRPADGRSAIDELTNKITQNQALLQTETERGNIKNITLYQDRVDGLMSQRRALEQNRESMYYVQIVTTLYADSLEELNRQSTRFENLLKGRRINMERAYLQQEAAYKSGLPIAASQISDRYRNFSTGALCACYPFYNSEVCHEKGTFIGINQSTGTPVFIDFYNRHILNNSNISVFGMAGSGKTFFVSMLTQRSALSGVRSIIIDPEGEYEKVTKALGGSTIKMMPGSSIGINPLDIEIEDETDEQGKPTGIQRIDIKSKVADVLDLLNVMLGGIPSECNGLLSNAIEKCYSDIGITADPQSVYESRISFDEKTGSVVQNKKKKMPTLSTLRRNIQLMLDTDTHNPNIYKLRVILQSMDPYIHGGIFDLFDRETSDELQDYLTSICLNFDVSHLERGTLRPLAMYVAMTWTWERIVKKNPHIKKRVVCDEAWMLVSNGIAGHEFTATALENYARRIRKRNGGLLVASQNFKEFTESSQGRAVLTNTACTIFLKQNATDIDAVQSTYRLSQGEKEYLLGAGKGEMLVKMLSDDLLVTATPSPFEYDLIATQK